MSAPGEGTFGQELSATRRVIREDGVDCHNEYEMPSIVTENASGSFSSTSSCDEWWNRMEAGISDETRTVNEKRSRMIQRVPELFRQKKSFKGCFDPMVVSVGPFHHGKLQLQEVERLKDSMALQFIGECKMQFSDVYSKVKEIFSGARKYYPEKRLRLFDEKAFIKLMFVDGCFVLQFIDDFLNKNEVKHMKSSIAAFVRRDLMLLENQLPYEVLKKLMSLRFKGNIGEDLINNFISSIRGDLSPQTTCIQATLRFFDKCRPILKHPRGLCSSGAEETNNINDPLHLLDIFLTKYINKDAMTQSVKNKPRDRYSYPAANQLRTMGIHFRPSAGEHFTDIEFRSLTLAGGWLFLPQIIIDDTNKSILLNLVAYEASPDAPDDDRGLTSYICFMDSLIDQAEDVKVLRSKGIVFNLLGTDQQAAELFNGIAQDLVPNPDVFCVTRKRIDSHSRSRIRTWMAEWIHTHFSSPWTFIAFIAVTATIVMTFLQTYVSVKGYCSGKGKQDHAS